MSKTKKMTKYPLIAVALIFLSNPNFSIIDILPDFISYFILASVFLDASEKAPYFKEARDAFLKLGWITLAKIPALLFIMWSKSADAFGNDMFAIGSFLFALFELILLLSAIRNTFDGLFRLGERTDAETLIAPITLSEKKKISTDALRGFTYTFVIIKAACSCLPDMLLLTTMKETSLGLQIITIDPKYPISLILAFIISLVFGIIWGGRIKKYAKAIVKSGEFSPAVDKLAENIPEERLLGIRRTREIKRIFLLLSISFALTLEMRFDNLYGVNLLPPTIFGIFLIITLISSRKLIGGTKLLIPLAAIYTAASTAAYVKEAIFLTEFGYESLLESDSVAHGEYFPVILLSVASTILYALLIICFIIKINEFTYSHTGISRDRSNYGPLELEYHRTLVIKNWIFASLAIVSAILKCVYVISSGNIEWIFTNPTDVIQPVIAAPAVEWIGFAASGVSIIFIMYALYHIATLKEESIAKYEFE